MAAWLPALKVVLPYLSHIVTAAAPVFTARRESEKLADLTAQQIAELQSAVTKNTESVKVLAEQFKRTITAIDEGSASLEQRLGEIRERLAAQEEELLTLKNKLKERHPDVREIRLLSVISLMIAAIALGLALMGLAS
jgi:septal ring factor EnvC (AmiA/AmiB activator)